MTITELYELVGQYSLAATGVASYYPRSPFIAWQEREVDYTSVSFVVENMTERDDCFEVDAIIYAGDRLMQDGSNFITIQDETAAILRTVINGLRNDDQIVDVQSDYTIEFFSQRLSDYLAGCWARIVILIPNDPCFEV